MTKITPLIKNFSSNKKKTKIKVFYVFLFYFINFSFINAQIIEGTLLSEEKKPLDGKLLIKKSSSQKIISEFSIIKNGEFSHELKKIYKESIIVEFISTGYTTYKQTIDLKQSPQIIEIHVFLSEQETHQLKEVFIQSKKKRFEVKEDTISYNVDAYKDGTERKLEDLLKKLPGVRINDKNGLVSYNGKLIETVLLEGDNLFGYNYTLGTKNINISIVEAVEAIENYSENPLLKGIENSNKVALNLKLKSKKTDYSGNLDFGLGFADSKSRTPINSSFNLLGINKYYKSFATISYNTIGQNLSPFNYFSFSKNLEQIKELSYIAERVIPETVSLDIVGEQRANINNQFFSNYNNLLNLTKDLKAKVNIYYINDSFDNYQNYTNNYQINDAAFTTFDNYQISKNPTQYRGDLELEYNASNSSMLKYQTSFRNENIITNKDIISNQDTNFNSSLESEDIFFKQKLVYTNKLNEDKVIQLSAHHSNNRISQTFNLEPSLLNSEENTSDSQKSDFEKVYLKFASTLLGKKNDHKYILSIGVNSISEPIKTQLTSSNSNNSNLENNLNYNRDVVYAYGSYSWSINKLHVSPKIISRYVNQSLSDESQQSANENERLVFEPSLSLFYKINSISSISANLNFSKNTNPSRYLFREEVLINNRNSISNSPNLQLQSNQSYGLSYIKNDLYNQSEINIGIDYSKQKGAFFLNSEITANRSLTNYFFLAEDTETINFNLGYSKFISALKTNFKYNSFYSVNNYKNVVNASFLRNNKSIAFSNLLFLKTAFESPINIENQTTYTINNSISEFEFSNKSLQNELKLIYKHSKRLYSTVTLDYFMPDTINKKNDISLLDATISYKPKKGNWELNVQGNNLTNQKRFLRVGNDDTSTNTFATALLPRYFLFNFYFSF